MALPRADLVVHGVVEPSTLHKLTTAPESQLEHWANRGAVSTVQSTHESVRTALSSYSWPQGFQYEEV